MSNHKEGKYKSPAEAILTGITDLFKNNPKAGIIREEERLEGKNVLITGASSGLGYAAAIQLAYKGANLFMACRSGIPEKGEEVKKISGKKDIHMLSVDLSDIASIQTMVANIVELEINFDIIICNAAIVPKESRKTSQGLEEMFVVNYLAKFLLIRLLFKNNCIRSSEEEYARIIFVSSESHRNPETFDWNGFAQYQSYGMKKTVERYGYYKLLLTTFAYELSRRVNSNGIDKVSIFTLCPGPVNTNIAREAPLILQPLLKIIFTLFFKSPRKAAESILYFAVSSNVEKKSFDYLHLMSRKDIDQKASDPENGKKLWEKTELLLHDLQIKI